MDSVTTRNTVLKRDFTAPEILDIKKNTRGIITIGGAGLASCAIGMGLVDEVHAFVVPVVLGSGRKWISGVPPTKLRLLGAEEPGDGVVLMRYGVLATHP
jgi:dihydrofolate reductase